MRVRRCEGLSSEVRLVVDEMITLDTAEAFLLAFWVASFWRGI